MVKKLLTFFFGICLMAGAASAQTESTFAADDIVYWIGEGDNQAILVVDFGDAAIAWGYRFGATNITISSMVEAIDAADPRFVYDNLYGDGELYYSEYPNHYIAEEYRIKANGEFVTENTVVTDGMLVKIGTSDDDVWSTAIVAVSIKEVPVDATIDAADVTYWVGEGANSAVIAVDWSNPGVAMAWGIHYDGTLDVEDALDYLAANDSRVTVESNSINFDEGSLHFSFQDVDGNILQFILDGNSYAGWDSELSNGSLLKIGESLFGEGIDSVEYYGSWYPYSVVWPTEILPVFEPLPDPLPTTATISADAITYWIGEGENKMIFVVNWPDTSLAWGYKFATETVSMTTVMDDIKAADPRFDYVLGAYGLDNITFTEGNVSLTGATYWEQLKNGFSGYGMGETFQNGDINLWGDASAGEVMDRGFYAGWGFYTINAYPMEIHPVSAPATDGIDEVADINVKVYPNPASSVLNVVCGSMEGDAVIYDMTGRKVYSQSINGESMTINTSVLANGVYMLHIGNSTTKVVVKH